MRGGRQCGSSPTTPTRPPSWRTSQSTSETADGTSLAARGTPDDYLAIHDWFDETKAHLADLRHRALRHHSEGIFLCETIFGTTITNTTGKQVPVRVVGEQHVKDDLGWIPTVKDGLQHLDVQPWMGRTAWRPMTAGDGPATPAASRSTAATD